MSSVNKRIEALENAPRSNIPINVIIHKNGQREKLQGVPLERIFQIGEENIKTLESDDPDILGLVGAMFSGINTQQLIINQRKTR